MARHSVSGVSGGAAAGSGSVYRFSALLLVLLTSLALLGLTLPARAVVDEYGDDDGVEPIRGGGAF